ncbi:MAG: hypothetical protein ACJ735_05390 [Actinomycetes bacterium]
MAIAWTLVALLSAATFSTIGLLATALFRLNDRIDGLGRGLRTEMQEMRSGLRTEMHVRRSDLRTELHELRSDLRTEIRALGDRLSAAGA